MTSLVRRVGKWTAWSLGVLLVLALLALGILFFLSERVIDHGRAAQGATVPVPTDPAALAEGERLARITGCTGCHEANLGGGLIFARAVTATRPTDVSSTDCAGSLMEGFGR